MKTLRLLAAAALALLASACIFHRHHVHDQVYGVPPGHARHAHVHGHACGHVLVDGVWVVVGVGHRGHH